MFQNHIRHVLLALSCAVNASVAMGAARYRLTDLGSVTPNAVNNLGHVVGLARPDFLPFASIPQSGRGPQMLAEAVSGFGLGLSASGVMVGSAIVRGSWVSQGFIQEPGQQGRFLGTVLNGVDYHASAAYGVNGQGRVVGEMGAFDLESDNRQAFVYVKGIFSSLGSLGGYSSAKAINEKDQITGTSTLKPAFYAPPHAFLYSNGVMKDLGTLGGDRSEGLAINDAGQVAGLSSLANSDGYPYGDHHAFLYTNGLMKDLGTLAGTRASAATGLNESGQVVGYAYGDDGLRAFVYDEATGMRDLTSLLSADVSDGWVLDYASAVNDDGVIVGWGRKNGVASGFMLSPVPEPGGLALVVAGLTASGSTLKVRRRERRRQ